MYPARSNGRTTLFDIGRDSLAPTTAMLFGASNRRRLICGTSVIVTEPGRTVGVITRRDHAFQAFFCDDRAEHTPISGARRSGRGRNQGFHGNAGFARSIVASDVGDAVDARLVQGHALPGHNRNTPRQLAGPLGKLASRHHGEHETNLGRATRGDPFSGQDQKLCPCRPDNGEPNAQSEL